MERSHEPRPEHVACDRESQTAASAAEPRPLEDPTMMALGTLALGLALFASFFGLVELIDRL